MKKPNFFIIGAPKCGTTSLAHYLSEHKQIFMSELKEPCYFSDDIDLYPGEITSMKKYENLFSEAQSNHIAVGEASTQYLYSKNAIDNILQYNSDAKFIAMLRNPVKMAYSLHAQQVNSLHEDIEDFKKAWYLQDERKKGNKIPSSCSDPKILQYGDWCKLGKQIKTLLRKVEETNVLVILLDDLKADPRKVYLEVLHFLGVSDDNRTHFPKLNQNKVIKSKLLESFIKTMGRIKRTLGITKPLKVSRIMNNTENKKRDPLSREMESILEEYFREDVHLLEKMIERDLSAWSTTHTAR